jgi:magnesium-protoporphyrin IX monomethyl ester (oxidative) cyclase
VISGEGDKVFPRLCNQIIHHNTECDDVLPQGVITKSNVNKLKEYQLIASVSADEIHCPNYDDYFSALEQYKYKDRVKPMLLVEASRGCWWGEKEGRRCRFCGLNGMNECKLQKERFCDSY